ncbi:methyltransferase regulatory domain-containing protein [Vulcanococcus limneticus]|uniref:methyltransferase regulatory domain-containing protein n=1 Tax=Vulcanococcus limneticus TaxID=2170428 RepID=UPI00398BE094
MANAMWDHGYHSRTTYGNGYYRELTPDWLDYAALIQSHQSPRHSDQSFRYLELGSGMGFGLCQMAVAYPEGQFVGVDFNPSHIAQAQALAVNLGLSNVVFLDLDFLDPAASAALRDALPGPAQTYHYVAAHGIYSWVVDEVRDALLRLASQALMPGGIFYCSYNCYPGWLGRSVFQKLLSLEQGRSDPSAERQCFEAVIAKCQHLLGTDANPSPLGVNLPFLKADLANLDLRNIDYLNGEYSNVGWAPVYAADVHQRCSGYRLSYLASASLPDCFEALLAASLREVVLQESNPLLRQTLIDLATNKSFRRDLFVKGCNRLSRVQADSRLAQVRFLPLESPAAHDVPTADAAARSPYVFMTSFGQVIGDPAVYGPIAAVLARSEGSSMEELQASAGESADELPIITSLFLDAGRIAFDRVERGEAALALAQKANRSLLKLIEAGRTYPTVILPLAGTSVEMTLVEVLILQAHRQGLQGKMLASCVNLGLDALGAQLLDASQFPIRSMSEALKRISAIAADCLERRLPMMRRLGAFPADWF